MGVCGSRKGYGNPKRNSFFRIFLFLFDWNLAFCDNWTLWPRGVTSLNGARSKKQVWRPMFEPKVFREQMYSIVLKKALVTLLGLFGAFRSDSAITSLSVYIETKRTHLGAVAFRFMGSIHNCTKDDIHKSSLLDLPNKLLTTIKHHFK